MIPTFLAKFLEFVMKLPNYIFSDLFLYVIGWVFTMGGILAIVKKAVL